jgi:chemotaxis protein MotA
MLTPLVGLVVLIGVILVALGERSSGKLSFLDWHAAIVVVGGVIGSVMLALERQALFRMLLSVRDLFPSASTFSRHMAKTKSGLDDMRAAWREGRRGAVLQMAEHAATRELQVAADALLKRQSGAVLAERFSALRTEYMHQSLPVIEGWEMVGKLAPSFGMVGTVTGMVQLFKNMAEESGNLGGAMAMALLATLYGITMGAALGGPMSSRINSQLNDRMTMLDLLEKTVAALVEEHSSMAVAAES